MRSHDRDESNTKISISLSKELLEELDKRAEEEGRTRSNMLQRIIAEYSGMTQRHGVWTATAAEPPGENYKTKK